MVMSELIGNHIKALVFDFDDTLVGIHLAIWQLHRYIAEEYYGVRLHDSTIKAHWGRPLQELARNYYQTDNTEAAIEKMMEHQQDFPKQKFEQSEPTIRNLKLGGKILGIVTATSRPILANDTKLVGLPLDNFDYIQTAEDSEHHKPDARVFEPMMTWMLKQEVSADNILYVGDGIQDMHAARTAGLHFIGVTTGLVSSEEFEAYGARHIPDISALL